MAKIPSPGRQGGVLCIKKEVPYSLYGTCLGFEAPAPRGLTVLFFCGIRLRALRWLESQSEI